MQESNTPLLLLYDLRATSTAESVCKQCWTGFGKVERACACLSVLLCLAVL